MRTFNRRSQILVFMAASAALPFAGNLAIAEPGAAGHAHKVFAAGEPGDPAEPARTINVAMTEGEGTMAYDPPEVTVKTGEQVKFVKIGRAHV